VADPTSLLVARARGHVDALCSVVPDRHPGSPGNAAAVELFERVAREHGWVVTSTPFECWEWEYGESWAEFAGRRPEAPTAGTEAAGPRIPLRPGPYSNPADVVGRVTEAATIEALEAGDFEGTVLVLHGAIAREQLMPKGFTFYNPDSHKRIYAALERQAPAAVVAVTARDPEAAGAVYPFPLIEDADFDIPNAYVADRDAGPLLAAVGSDARLRIESRRVPARGRQPVASKPGSSGRRVVVFAHIDGRKGLPCALDNASGAASLMVLLEVLADHRGPHAVELVPLNGEDYYGACGQKMWMRENVSRLGEIVLGMNADDSGHVGAGTSVSFYNCPPQTDALVRALFARYPGFGEGPQWPQGDHSLFAFNGVPAIAFTAEDFMETFRTITHTSADQPALVDPAIVADVARFMADVIAALPADA
jgi:aminopeptidase YwaD